jgi:xanthine dehydrogenase molybdenum-binding subunit
MYGIKEGEEYKPWLWPVPEGSQVGKRRIRRLDGLDKVSGKAVYTRDVIRPGMLFAKPLTAPHGNGKIISMDISKAEAYPGVRAVLRYDEDWAMKPAQGTMMEYGKVRPETILTLKGRVDWYGEQYGAVVVADSEQICDEALRLIEIEWEMGPVVLDWDEAIKPGAPLVRPDLNPDGNLNTKRSGTRNLLGDVEEGFKQSENIIEFEVKVEEDKLLNVEAAVAVVEFSGDTLEYWVHAHNPNGLMTSLPAAGYGTPGKVICHGPYNGGTFNSFFGSMGGPNHMAAWAAEGARRTGKPVKSLFDGTHFWGIDFSTGTHRWKVGYNNDGTIMAVKGDSVFCEYSYQREMAEGSKVPNLSVDYVFPMLNRGPGNVYKDGKQTSINNTQVFNRVAAALNMDPTEVALKNDGCEGHDMAWINEEVKAKEGFDPTIDSLRNVLEAGKEAIDWDNRWHQPGTKILPNGNYHGIGFTWANSWNVTPGTGACAVKMESNGKVYVFTHRADTGQCPDTTYAMVLAGELGVKYEDVSYSCRDWSGFVASGPSGSSGNNGNMPCMVRAARKLKQIILDCAVSVIPASMGFFGATPEKPPIFPDKKAEDLDMRDGVIFEKANPDNKQPISAITAAFGSKLYAWDAPPSLMGVESFYMPRQCYFMEVEVDPDTGGVDVTKCVVVNDVGRAINPDSLNGQQYGGTYMGIWRSGKGAMYYDAQTGVMLNDNYISYPATVMNDCGPIDCHLLESGLGWGAYGATGIGESGGAMVGNLVPIAVFNAIGKWVDSPSTPDKILKALGKA